MVGVNLGNGHAPGEVSTSQPYNTVVLIIKGGLAWWDPLLHPSNDDSPADRRWLELLIGPASGQPSGI